MTGSTRAGFAIVLALITLKLAAARPVHAVCPDQPCDCVGDAGAYRAVGSDELLVGSGFERQLGARIGSVVYGDLCAQVVQIDEPGSEANPDDIEGDLHALAGAGQVAVNARIIRPDPGASVVVSGVLATGGGSVSGPVTAGTLDTTGAHPGVAACQQAVADVQTASSMLAGLAPTQVFPRIVADGSGTDDEIVAGPGVNVIQVDGRISVRTVLVITLDPATHAVIINAGALAMKRFSRIVVLGGDDTKVLINLPGSGPAVAARYRAEIVPMVLAPDRVVRIGTQGRFAGMYGKRVLLRGVFLDQISDMCPAASPSGAFLETPASF